MFLGARDRAALAAKSKPTGRGKPVTYAAVVNARTAIQLNAYAARREASSTIALEAHVTIAGAALLTAPSVVADVRTPTGLRFDVPLKLAEPGRYFGEFQALRPGDYPTRFRTRGLSPRAFPFLREQVCTPAVTLGEPSQPKCRQCAAPLPSWLSSCGLNVKRMLECVRGCKPVKGRAC